MKKLIIIPFLILASLVNAQNLYDAAKKISLSTTEGQCISAEYLNSLGINMYDLKELQVVKVCSLPKEIRYATIDSILLRIDDLNNIKMAPGYLNLNYDSIASIITELQNKIQLQRLQGIVKSDNLRSLNNLFTGQSISLSPTYVIDEASKFLVERTKIELSISLVSKLRVILQNDTILTTLFPLITNVILYNDPLNYSVWGSQLSYAAKSDLSSILPNLSLLLQNSIMDEELDTASKEIIQTILLISRIIQLQKEGLDPIQALYIVNDEFGVNIKDIDRITISRCISFLTSITESFSRNNSSGYVPADSILNMSLSEQEVFSDLFIVKYRQLLETTEISQDKSLYTLLKSNLASGNTKSFFIYVGQLSENYKRLKKTISDLQNSTADRDEILQIYKSINNYTSTLLDIGYNLCYLNNIDLAYSEEGYFQKHKPLVLNLIDLSNCIYDKNFTCSLVSLNNILSKSFESIITNTDIVERRSYYKMILNDIFYWGGFITEVASADSVVRIKEILNKYAEPVGSYRIKRNSLCSVSVNAFPGFYIGADIIDLEDIKLGNGITAPIGISFNKSGRKKASINDFDFCNKRKCKKISGSTWGLFLPVIDIGAPFVYRWSNDETKGFPKELEWEQVFAPGMYLSYGFKNSGFTLMCGGQMAPSLRKITENDLILQKDTWRFGITCSYDIPLFTMYKKTRKPVRLNSETGIGVRCDPAFRSRISGFLENIST